MDTTFSQTGPFTEASIKPFADARDPRFDNQPPLDERVMLEFEEELERQGVKARIHELLVSAGRVPEVTTEEIAGKVGDLCRLARDVEKKVADARETHNRPLLNAQRALKSKADGLLAPLLSAIAEIRTKLNAYVAEQERKAAEERRRIAEEERKAREALEQAGVSEEVIATTVQAPKVDAPVARGDLGARVGSRTVWRFEREVEVKKLPKAILENATVVEAVDKVIGQMVRAGTREIRGVRIWEAKEAAVR